MLQRAGWVSSVFLYHVFSSFSVGSSTPPSLALNHYEPYCACQPCNPNACRQSVTPHSRLLNPRTCPLSPSLPPPLRIHFLHHHLKRRAVLSNAAQSSKLSLISCFRQTPVSSTHSPPSLPHSLPPFLPQFFLTYTVPRHQNPGPPGPRTSSPGSQ